MTGSRSLLTALEGFLRDRHVEVGELTADQAVDLMLAWMRVPAAEAGTDRNAPDLLMYRYGGWSEGCATAFKLSLLRQSDAGEAGGQLAGITLMFEPSAGGALTPFSTTTREWPSVAAFAEAIRQSPAYRQYGGEKPMSVAIERGGLR